MVHSIQFLNQKLFFQFTPLHMAAEGGYVSIVEFLVVSGAKIDVKDNTDVSISLLAGPTCIHAPFVHA